MFRPEARPSILVPAFWSLYAAKYSAPLHLAVLGFQARQKLHLQRLATAAATPAEPCSLLEG